MFLTANNKINITLCGMMGAGKSVIGKKLAEKIDFSFFDIDNLIEKNARKSINKIFKDHGEKYFRDLEEKITLDVLQNKKSIISLGGGAISNSKIRSLLKKNSLNIYLKVSINSLEKRLKNSKNRPLLNKNDLNLILIELLKKREKFYKKADLIIENKISINRTVENIIDQLNYDKKN